MLTAMGEHCTWYTPALSHCVFPVFLRCVLLRQGFCQQLPLCINDSHVIPTAAFVINKNVVILLPVKIFLDVICWINDTDFLCFLTYFRGSRTVLSCEPVVDESGQTEYETAPKLLL